jgi:hypothetical protein
MENKGENPKRVSATEDKIQSLSAELLFADEKRRKEIKAKIESLKQTPEGEKDQKKHNQIMRGEE